jgi:hypothetical protein
LQSWSVVHEYPQRAVQLEQTAVAKQLCPHLQFLHSPLPGEHFSGVDVVPLLPHSSTPWLFEMPWVAADDGHEHVSSRAGTFAPVPSPQPVHASTVPLIVHPVHDFANDPAGRDVEQPALPAPSPESELQAENVHAATSATDSVANSFRTTMKRPPSLS